MTDLPPALSARSALKMRSISTSESVAVGSSRMNTRASRVSMRASSISCRRPMLSCGYRRVERQVAEADLFQRRARRARAAPRGGETAGRRRFPSQMLSSTDSAGAKLSSCATNAMPRSWACWGSADFRRLAVDQDDAFVDLVHAGEDLDQRALARAVLAADGADFLRVDRQRDVLENRVRAEPLGCAFDGEDRRRRSTRAANRSSASAPSAMGLSTASPAVA